MVKSTKAGLLPSGPSGPGTRGDPWVLKTPSGQSECTAYRDETADPPALVVQVGKTELRYQLRCIDDLAHMLAVHAFGCRSAAQTSRSRPHPGPLRPEAARHKIRCVDGTGSRRAYAAAWQTMCLR